MDFIDIFNILIKEQKYLVHRSSAYKFKSHKKNCSFIRASSEPRLGTMDHGSCATCTYVVSVIYFIGKCTCEAETEFYIDEAELNFANIVNNCVEISK